jgi:hypothetical protein
MQIIERIDKDFRALMKTYLFSKGRVDFTDAIIG